MNSSISSLSFSALERKYYAAEFDRLTEKQENSIVDRTLSKEESMNFLKRLKISRTDCDDIWNLVSENQNVLKLPNFMAAMRLCSVLKQGLRIGKENLIKEQSVLARKSKDKDLKNTEDSKQGESANKKIENGRNREINERPNNMPIMQEAAQNILPKIPALSDDKKFIAFEKPIENVFSGNKSPLKNLEENKTPMPQTEIKTPNPVKTEKSIFQAPLNLINATEPSTLNKREITVETPTMVSSGWFGSSSYHTYPIITQINDQIYRVTRRFSDLDWMNNLLVKNYPGFLIPPRPDKRIINNNNDKFIEERRLQIEKYLNIILNNPVLGMSMPFKVFTQTRDENFEIEKKSAEESQENLQAKSFEDLIDTVYAKFKTNYQQLFTDVPIKEDIENIVENIIKLDSPTQLCIDSFQDWTNQQKLTIDAFSELQIPEEPDISDIFQQHSKNFQQNFEELYQFHSDFSNEHLRLEGLKQAINSYKGSINKYHEQEALISRKYAKHKNSYDEETASRYLQELEYAEEDLEKLTKSLSKIESNLLQENMRFEATRSEEIMKTVIGITKRQREFYEKECVFWQNALDKF